MATSTILENIRVNNPKVIEEFVEFMENSVNEQTSENERSSVCDDPDKIRDFMDKALKSKGI